MADAPDGGSIVARMCRFGALPDPLVSIGESCFCDGPFVVSGDLVYRHGYELEVIDVATPRVPTLLARVPRVDAFAEGIAISGRSLVIAGGVVEIFDLADPRAPVSAATLEVGGGMSTAVVTVGRHAWIASSDAARVGVIEAVDVSSPSAPVRAGRVTLGARRSVRALAANANALFALVDEEHDADPWITSSLVVVDLDAAAPSVVVETPLGSGGSLAELGVEGDLLAVALLGEGARLFDITSPAAPRELTRIVGSSGAIAFSGDLAILPTSTSAMALFDVSDPAAPLELARLPLASDTWHAAFLGDAVLVSGGGGLTAVPFVCE